MSNSRKIKRSVKRNVSTSGAVLAGASMLAGGLMLVPGTAFAVAPPTISSPSASSQPTIAPGTTGAAGNESFTITNSFNAGDKIAIDVGTGTVSGVATNTSTTAGNFVQFAGAPTVTVTGGAPGSAAPMFTEALTFNKNDTLSGGPPPTPTNGAATDELDLTFQNSSVVTGTGSFTITISGINYQVGAAAPNGPVNVSGTVFPSGSTTGTTTALASNAKIGTPVAPNANVILSEAPTGVGQFQTAAPVSNIVLTDLAGVNDVGPGIVSAYDTDGGGFVGSVVVTATNGATVAPVATGGACPTSGAGSATIPTANGMIQFCVVSGGTNASFTVSGISFDPTANSPAAAPAGGAALSRAGTTSSLGGNRVFVEYPRVEGAAQQTISTDQPAITVLQAPATNGRIAGFTADDTAAQAAEQVYGAGGARLNGGTGGAVIIASDAEYQDALSASYLGHEPLQYQKLNSTVFAQQNGTPILLNPPAPPSGGESSTAAANAIRTLGASTVYLIGGTDALSADVATQLSQMQVGETSTGTPENLQVIRIAGVTAPETAKDVAQYPGLPNGQVVRSTPGAFGLYNSGASESSAPTTAGAALKTAVLANTDEFQDALSASPLAYSQGLPVLLTHADTLDPNAAQALSNLGIQQVLAIGGTSVLSDAVVSQIEALGITVLRIAGTDAQTTAVELAQYLVNDYTAGTSVFEGLNLATSPGADDLPAHNTLFLEGTSRGDAFQDALSASQVLGANNLNVTPLLLTAGTSTLSNGSGSSAQPGAWLGAAGTPLSASPGGNGGLPTVDNTAPAVTGGWPVYMVAGSSAGKLWAIGGDTVFGGTLAQTPALVQSEYNTVAAG